MIHTAECIMRNYNAELNSNSKKSTHGGRNGNNAEWDTPSLSISLSVSVALSLCANRQALNNNNRCATVQVRSCVVKSLQYLYKYDVYNDRNDRDGRTDTTMTATTTTTTSRIVSTCGYDGPDVVKPERERDLQNIRRAQQPTTTTFVVQSLTPQTH